MSRRNAYYLFHQNPPPVKIAHSVPFFWRESKKRGEFQHNNSSLPDHQDEMARSALSLQPAPPYRSAGTQLIDKHESESDGKFFKGFHT
jgi:hypothetical protein